MVSVGCIYAKNEQNSTYQFLISRVYFVCIFMENPCHVFNAWNLTRTIIEIVLRFFRREGVQFEWYVLSDTYEVMYFRCVSHFVWLSFHRIHLQIPGINLRQWCATSVWRTPPIPTRSCDISSTIIQVKISLWGMVNLMTELGDIYTHQNISKCHV